MTGEARGTWYFEASFPVQVLDKDGNVFGGDEWANVFGTKVEIENVYKTKMVGFLTIEKVAVGRKITRTQKLNPEKVTPNVKMFLDKSGYTLLEMALIEESFEKVEWPMDKTLDDYMHDGLMAVMDALMTIHKATTTEITQAKSLFKKELAEVG